MNGARRGSCGEDGPSKAAGVEFIAENGGAGERLRK